MSFRFIFPTLFFFGSFSVLAGAPEISRVSPFQAGEVFQIFGEHFEGAEVFAWSGEGEEESDGMPTLESGEVPDLPPEGATRARLVESLPQMLTGTIGNHRGVGVLWVRNEEGTSAPMIFNRPEIWNQSAPDATPGERFQIFGQNLRVRFRGRPWCVLRCKESGEVFQAVWGTVQTQSMSHQEEFKMEVRMPEEIPAGSYELLVHNGTGGARGWSEPAEVTMLEERDWLGMMHMAWNRIGSEGDDIEAPDIPSVRIDSVLGDGLQDATDAIQNAITEMAKVGGGIVSLPPGTYGVTRTIALLPGVVLKGAGRGATTLTVPTAGVLRQHWEGLNRPPPNAENTPLLWMQADAGIEDLSLLGGPGVGNLVYIRRMEDPVADRIFFNRVDMDLGERRPLMEGGDFRGQGAVVYLFDFENSGFTMWNCHVRGMNTLSIVARRSEYVRLIGNTFEDSPRQTSDNVFVRGAIHCMIVENTFLGGRRTMVSQRGFSNNWVFQNRSKDVGRGENAHEEFMTEGGNATWLGNPKSVMEASIILPDDMKLPEDLQQVADDRGIFVIVVQGRGFGQYRKVDRIEGRDIGLHEAWDVLPDSESTLALGTASVRNLWVNNTTGPGAGISQFVYGTGLENIIAGHHMLQNAQLSLFAASPSWSEDGHIHRYGILAFHRIVGCQAQFSGGHNAAFHIWSRSDQEQFYTGEPLTIFGNILRENVVSGGSETAQFRNQGSFYWAVPPGHRMFFEPENASGIEINGGFNLVENNFLLGFPVGIRVRGDAPGNLLIKNRMDFVERAVLDPGGAAMVVTPDHQDY